MADAVLIRPGGPGPGAMVGRHLLKRKLCIGCGVRLDFWGRRPHPDLTPPLNCHRHGCRYGDASLRA
jgi:hypothetical protein